MSACYYKSMNFVIRHRLSRLASDSSKSHATDELLT
nr:MAG TPA: hypothetical protein [Caudoviricetes sp.]